MPSPSSPAPSPAPDLRVRLLGGLAVEGIAPSALGSRKGRHVLALLALAAGRPVGIDALVEAVWTGPQPARPAEDLGVLVSRLRGALGAEAIVRTDAGYALGGAWIDLVELEARVTDAAAALERGQPGAARAAAEAALQLVRGPLLPELDDVAVAGSRQAAARAAAQARHVIARSAAAMGDHEASAVAAEAALDHDPYDEVALRLLMEAHAAAGRVASALAAYVRVRERMVEDLGVTPGAATEALHDRLVLGAGVEPPPGPPAAAPARRRSDGAGLVGRASELAILDGALAEAAAGGQARSVQVSGEAGIGKSALLSKWFAGLTGRAVVLAGRCDALGRDLPLQPVADALSSHLRALGPAGAAAVLGPDADVVADLLGLPGGAGGSGGGQLDTDPGRGQVRLFAGLLAVVERCGDGGPVVLAVDDVHLADPLTASWLGFARRRGHQLVVVSAGLTAAHSSAPDAAIVLGPLGRAEAAVLTGLPDGDRLATIHRRAGGNPLFLLALAAGGPGEAGDEPPPASVRDAVRRQVNGLGEAAATLAIAAVLGREIDLDLLAGLVDRSAAAVLEHLEAALAAGILVERGAGLEFHHELVRTALADDLTAARRRLLHHDAARALAARPAADPLKIAVHARHGGDLALAVEQYVAAGLEALGRFDTAAAAGHLDAAVGLGGSEAAFAARARLRLSRWDLDGARADATRAVEIGGGPAALEIAAWVAYYRRSYDEARVLAEAGAARAEDAALRASCQAVAGRVRHGAGDLDGASTWLATVAGAPPHVQGVADVWLGFCRVHQGAMEEALETLAAPLIDADRLAHPWAGLHGRFAAVMALGNLGRLGEALARCDDLDAAVRREGEVGARFRAPAANVRGWLLRHGGAPEAGDDANRHALELTVDEAGRPTGDSVLEYHYVAMLDLADGCLLAGDPAGAADLAERLEPADHWGGTMAWHQRHRLGLLRARLALADGDPDGAAGLATAVLEDARSRGAGRYEVLAQAWLALAAGPDADAVAPVVGRLATVASLEGWRLTAALGRRYRNDAWIAEAGRRAAALASTAGPQAEPLRTAIAAELG